MKKLIGFLSVFSFTTYSTTYIISCDKQSNKKHLKGKHEKQDNEENDNPTDELKQVKNIIKKLEKLTIRSSLKADNQNTINDLIEKQLSHDKKIDKIVGDFNYNIISQEDNNNLLKAKKYQFKIELILQNHVKPISTTIFVIVENNEKLQTNLTFKKNAQIIKKYFTSKKSFDLSIYKELNVNGNLTWEQFFTTVQNDLTKYFKLDQIKDFNSTILQLFTYKFELDSKSKQVRDKDDIIIDVEEPVYINLYLLSKSASELDWSQSVKISFKVLLGTTR